MVARVERALAPTAADRRRRSCAPRRGAARNRHKRCARSTSRLASTARPPNRLRSTSRAMRANSSRAPAGMPSAAASSRLVSAGRTSAGRPAGDVLDRAEQQVVDRLGEPALRRRARRLPPARSAPRPRRAPTPLRLQVARASARRGSAQAPFAVADAVVEHPQQSRGAERNAPSTAGSAHKRHRERSCRSISRKRPTGSSTCRSQREECFAAMPAAWAARAAARDGPGSKSPPAAHGRRARTARPCRPPPDCCPR